MPDLDFEDSIAGTALPDATLAAAPEDAFFTAAFGAGAARRGGRGASA